MSFRARLLVAFLPIVLLSMIALALVIREEMEVRLSAQYERRLSSLVSVIQEDLALEGEAIAQALAALRVAIVNDNRFRQGAVDHEPEERRYMLDYAANHMQLAGLSMLQIQDEEGRIVSSGHFRNEYDRMDPELPGLLATASGGRALVKVRTSGAPFLALARVDSFQMGGRRFTIVGGVTMDRRFLDRLAREDDIAVSMIYPGGMLTSGEDHDHQKVEGPALERDEIVRDLGVPFIEPEGGRPTPAQIRVSQPLDEWIALRRSIDLWIIIAMIATGAFACMLTVWLASWISRPLVELADKTSRIDLDRPEVGFETRRGDEIGVLTRLLGAMSEKLRASADRIKDAERHAALGELARQVNHDIKNGLVPLHNVFRHLAQLARDDPEQLPKVFLERQKTLDSSMAYLENLASNYARLYPRIEGRACDVNAIIRRVVEEVKGPDRTDIRTDLCDRAIVLSDPVALRRIVENLVSNAIDSLESQPGKVTVSTALVPGEDGRRQVRITVADTGRGMTEEQQQRAFDDFYTTKDNGTGLGLSIVRRLIGDLGGSIRMESEAGTGSRFIIDLPGASGSSGKAADRSGGPRGISRWR